MEQIQKGALLKNLPWRGGVYLTVGLLLLGWLFNTPAGLLGKADAVGYAVCHRIDARSFHINERQSPLCARCTGMYLGAVVALAFQAVLGKRRMGFPPKVVLAVITLLALLFAVDGTNSFLALILHHGLLYEPHNWLRLLTGTGMGLAIASVLFPSFNQTIWRDWDERPVLPGMRSLVGLVFLALAVDALVLTGNVWVLYPLALLSAAGALILLTMVYTMVLVMLFRKENQFWLLRQMVLPLIGGFALALLQIALLDLARYWLTGNWGGFYFG